MKSNNNVLIRIKKGISLLILFTLFIYLFSTTQVNALTQTREPISDKLNNYPGYTELINELKQAHPDWNFTIFYTGLDWEQVIKNETTACHGRNVVPSSKSGAWKCAVCGETSYGGSSWRCASEAAVSYYMDPRNWLNDTYIFQFENLSYNGDIQTVEGVQKIISSIKYMQGERVTYTKTDGTKGTLDKSYAQIIMEAAKEAGISPYHLASRIRQEQGTGTTPGSTATGTYSGYVGYYNFLNIKASGSTDSQVIVNGLEYAKNNNWTDPEISIKAGAKVLAKNYINDGQDTLYLQKFDVDNSDGTLYYFQYMQNVSVCLTEGSNARKAYEELGLIDSSIEFIIPVYENMPETACPEPIDASIVTQNIKVLGTNVAVRSGASISATKITTVNTGDILLRIEIASTMNDGYYWDKVVLSDGTKGYMVRNYIVEIENVTNCNDTVVANTSVNLRNGPGLDGTTIITTLVKGQVVTRIETGKYNLNGYIWDRVVLVDGRQGYVAQNYIGIPNNGENGETTEEIIKVMCKSGLKVREQPGTDQKVITYLSNGDILTRTQKDVSTANGYIWDKVVTNDGIEGYVARGDSTEQYIEVVITPSIPEEPTTPTDKNSQFKLEDDNLICEPNTTIEDIKEKYSETEIIVKKSDGTIVDSGNVGTGYVITIADKTYTIIKLGDINGDGHINTGDTFLIKQVIMEVKQLNDENAKKVADINLDGDINTGDSFILKKHVMNVSNITI